MVESALKSQKPIAAYITSATPAQPLRRRISWRRFAPAVFVLALLLLWHLVTHLALYPAFLIPPPKAVWDKFWQVLGNGLLLDHASVTLYQMLMGLGIGVSIGVLVGYAIAKSRLLEEILSPVVVAFQSTPIVAYAPLLIIWFGGGVTSKIVTCALIVFFPMLMNVVVGVRGVPQDQRDLLRLWNASAWQTFYQLELPAALPILLTGLKTSATLALIGAVVGEFVSANKGLGFLVNLARTQFDTPLVFVVVLSMTALSLSLYSLVSMLEWRLLRARRQTAE